MSELLTLGMVLGFVVAVAFAIGVVLGRVLEAQAWRKRIEVAKDLDDLHDEVFRQFVADVAKRDNAS